MERVEKQKTVESLNQVFSGANTVIVAHYKGLSVDEITTLRKRLANIGASFRVTKNRLAKIALKGTDYEKLDEYFNGPTAVAYSNDPVAAAKGIVEYAKQNEKLVVVAGSMNGNQLDKDAVKSLASLPSLDELRAKIVGMISTPATRIAGVVQAPGGQIARVLNARSQQQG